MTQDLPRRRACGALAMLALLPAGAVAAVADMAGRPRHLVVIPKSSDQLFWDLVRSGVEQAVSEAEKAGAKLLLTWRGPAYSGDAEAQIRILRSYTRPGVDVIVLAAADRTLLRDPVKAAVAAGIPVIVVDSALDGDAHLAQVTTDNLAAGRQAAREMARRLSGKGDVMVLRTLPGSASTFDRGRGFVDELRVIAPGIRIVADAFGGGSPGDLRARAGEMLQAHPAVDGIFTVNESSTDGMLRALRSVVRQGRPVFIGFDTTPFLLEALGSGEIAALVIQDPRRMGQLGAQLALRLIAGEHPSNLQPIAPLLIDTHLVTRQNMADPAVRKLMCLSC
ncbi:substrate-binding domain-containing protein [Leptothrix sp. BB-4]